MASAMRDHDADSHKEDHPVSDPAQPLIFETRGPVAILTLNRPERLNALSADMQRQLINALATVEQDAGLRAIVLTGAGRGFCAGGDIKNMGETRLAGSQPRLRPLGQLWGALPLAIRACSRPVVAAINGAAAGAGFDIALACDVCIGSTEARFAASFTRIGLVPDNGGMYLLPRAVGTQRACELIFSGRIVGAEEAREYGILLDIVEPAALLEQAVSLAETFAANAPLAVQLAKRGIYAAQDLTLERSFDHVNFAQTYLQHTADHREGVRAFLDKSEPRFEGA